MAKEQIDTDRVNYLIWRYLVETGYGETAVRFQTEWNVCNPQELPFAPHVTNHALVGVLNRGLLYNVHERETIEMPCHVSEPPRGVFGPLMPESPPPDEDFEHTRKRQIDNEQAHVDAGPPAKKPRLSNGHDNSNNAAFETTTTTTTTTTTAMDVDDDQNAEEKANAYPSPEQLPSPVPLATVGPEQGTQVDKVVELSTLTTFLELSEDPSTSNSVLLQCEFNPRDATILAAAGTDALARMWTLSRTAVDAGSESPGPPPLPVFTPHHSLLAEDTPPSTTVTGIAWSSDGLHIAVSSEPVDDGSAKVEFWTLDGAPYALFNGFDSPVICLRWDPTNTTCLAISTQDNATATLVTVMNPTSEESTKFSLPQHCLDDRLLDAVWTSHDEFLLCGGDVLQAFSYLGNAIAVGRKYETHPGQLLAKIVYDWHSRLIATSSDAGIVHIWDRTAHCRSLNAHQGVITSLAWQPVPIGAQVTPDAERLLASAGEDGAISIWNARSLENKSKSSMTMGSAVLALRFTPDGAFIAGGTSDHVFIWKTDDTHIPRATWNRGDESGWRTPRSQGSTEDDDQYSLCWNAHGQLLAYGVNSRLAVMNFRT